MGIRDKIFMPSDEEGHMVKKVGEQVYDSMADHADDLVVAAKRIAAKKGFDHKYLLYLLVHQPKTWGPHAGRHGNAVRRAVDLAIDRSNKMVYDDYTIPPAHKESDVDKALGLVAKWAGQDFVETMQRAYADALRGLVSEAVSVIQHTFKEAVSDDVAYVWLQNIFTEALENKPFGMYKRNWLALMLSEFR